jgi:hypothetical protein
MVSAKESDETRQNNRGGRLQRYVVAAQLMCVADCQSRVSQNQYLFDYMFSVFLMLFFPFYFQTAPSFVPRSNALGPMPKQLVAQRTSASRRNDIKMMPIGVPKVAYRIPGSQSADW